LRDVMIDLCQHIRSDVTTVLCPSFCMHQSVN